MGPTKKELRMRISRLLFSAVLGVAALPGYAQSVKTRTQDVYGTKFVVVVDWDHELVTVKLRANPAHLSGAAFEHALQNAVYYGSAVNCRLLDHGRVTSGHEISGSLHCPWF